MGCIWDSWMLSLPFALIAFDRQYNLEPLERTYLLKSSHCLSHQTLSVAFGCLL